MSRLDIDYLELRERASLEVADHAHVAVAKDELLTLLDDIDRLRAECHGRRFDPNLVEEVKQLRTRYSKAHADCQEMIRLNDEHDAARSTQADVILDLASRIHSLADEYAGPRPIASTPLEDLAAIENTMAGDQHDLAERNAQLDATRNAIGAECVEHVELNGHIDLAEQCRDYLNHEADCDTGGRLRDFARALRIVIDQCDLQRRRANWYEAAYTAGKQKLIESAVERALSQARAAAQVYVERVDALGLAADDNDPLVMATAEPIGAAQADLYAALGLLERSESGEVVVKPPTETVDQLRAERDVARMLAEVRGRERDQLKEQLADAHQQVSDLSDQMQSMVEQARREAGDLWAACEEPPSGDGVPVCGWTGEMSQLVDRGNGVTSCPNCGSTAIREDIDPNETP